jgi:hypothetical protein
MFANQHGRFAASSHATARLVRAERCFRCSSFDSANSAPAGQARWWRLTIADRILVLQTSLRPGKPGGGVTTQEQHSDNFSIALYCGSVPATAGGSLALDPSHPTTQGHRNVEIAAKTALSRW